jgi:hypothetical protein
MRLLASIVLLLVIGGNAMSQEPEEGSGDKGFIRPPPTLMELNACKQERDRLIEELKTEIRNVELKLEAEDPYKLGSHIIIRLLLLNHGNRMIDMGTNDPVSKFEVLVTDQSAKPLPYTELEERNKRLPSSLYIWGAPNKRIEAGQTYEAKLNLSYIYLFKSPGIYHVHVKAKDDIYRRLKVDQYSLTIKVE